MAGDGFVSKQTEPHVSSESGVEPLHESASGGAHALSVSGWCSASRRFRCHHLAGRAELTGGCVGGSGLSAALLTPRCSCTQNTVEAVTGPGWEFHPRTFLVGARHPTRSRRLLPSPCPVQPCEAPAQTLAQPTQATWKTPSAEAEPSSAAQGDLNFCHSSYIPIISGLLLAELVKPALLYR